ncbi:MAG: ABC transporter substrate-binding protein [Chloroflexota bacterium]|nr:ABC transporter substrate-binding protein [Chloroflexota bacterium]
MSRQQTDDRGTAKRVRPRMSRRSAFQLGTGAALGLTGMRRAHTPATRAAGQDGTATPTSGGTLRYGAVRDASIFDPHAAGGVSHGWLVGNIYDKLIDFGPEGDFVGALAESWESVDALHYTFALRQGVTFHNGQPFTSRDVVATIDRIKDPEIQATNADVAANLTVEAADDFTVNLTLAELDLSLFNALAGDAFYIMSADDVGNVFDSPDNYNGTGPFTLEGWEPRSYFNLTKYPGFWKPGQPYLDRVELRPILDDAARVDALLSGEADLIEYVPWQSFEIVETAGFQLFPSYGLQSFIRFNQSQPPLDSKPLRQAISYIINRDEINQIAFGGLGKPITGPLQPEDSPYYFEELEGSYQQDWERATELIQEAGYASVADVPPIDFQVSTSALSQQPAQVIQQQLQDFGLTVEFRTVDVATLLQNRADGTYVLHMDGGGMAWPDPDYLRSIFHSADGTVYAVGVEYGNPELDALLEQGADTEEVAARQEIYRQVEQIILDDVPWAFVLWRTQAEAAAPYVRGYYDLPAGLETYRVDHFEAIWFDQ